MNKLKILSVLIGLIFFASLSVNAEMGVPLQIKLKSPAGTYPSESGVSVKVYVLSPTTNCILREENFSGQEVVNGNLSVRLGSGTLGSYDPGLTLNQVYNNSSVKNGLSCVDANNNVTSIGQSYTPSAADYRVIRITTNINTEDIVVNFTMRSVPYAIQAESVGGKSGADILVQNTSTQLTQANLNNLLSDVAHFNNLKNLASGGAVNSAANFTGSLGGDVAGTQGGTVVGRIRGINVSTTAPVNGDVLRFNGTQYVPTALPAAPVTSVAGKTGAVVLAPADISGLGSAATLNAGTSANNLVQLDSGSKIPLSLLPNSVLTASTNLSGDVTGPISSTTVSVVGGKSAVQISSAVDEVSNATSTNAANTLIKRDASGNAALNSLSSSNLSSNNLYLFDGGNSVRLKAPAGLTANYVLNLPPNSGSTGQFLQTDGSGNLVWADPSIGGSVTAVTATAPLFSSGGAAPNISLTQAGLGSSGYLSSSDFSSFSSKQNALGFTPLNPSNNLSELASAATARANLGLGAAAVLNVGTAASTVAAGNDSRIVNAVQSSAYNADVAGAASCTSTQTAYWNTVSDAWACQNISYPADAVSSVAGRTGAVVLSSSDISGLGSAATLAYGASAGQLVQLDASARIPASAIPTNALTTSSNFAGDVSGNSSALSVDRIKGVPVSANAPTAGQALVYNGSEWVPTTGFPIFVKKSANQVFANTAQANVNDLSFNVTAGVMYKYKFIINYSSAATSTGLRLSLTYPASTMASAVAKISNGGDGTGAYFHGTINSSGDTVNATGTSSTAAAGHLAFVEGVIVSSADGVMQLRAASEINGSNITIKAGSFVEITIVP